MGQNGCPSRRCYVARHCSPRGSLTTALSEATLTCPAAVLWATSTSCSLHSTADRHLLPFCHQRLPLQLCGCCRGPLAPARCAAATAAGAVAAAAVSAAANAATAARMPDDKTVPESENSRNSKREILINNWSRSLNIFINISFKFFEIFYKHIN